MKLINVGVAAAFGLGAGSASALEILHYDDHGRGLVQASLLALGETATQIDEVADLSATLGSQAWDVVIIDSSVSSLSDSAAVASYVQGGGKVVMAYWNTNSEPALAGDFMVSAPTTYSAPQDVNQWVADPIFSTPFAVSDPIDGFSDSSLDDGDEYTVLAGGIAVAGFSPTPEAGRAGIVIGNDGRTIINGFVFGNWDGSDLNMVNLVANQIAMLGGIDAPSSEIPLPAAAPLLAAGLGGLVLLRRRRKG